MSSEQTTKDWNVTAASFLRGDHARQIVDKRLIREGLSAKLHIVREILDALADALPETTEDWLDTQKRCRIEQLEHELKTEQEERCERLEKALREQVGALRAAEKRETDAAWRAKNDKTIRIKSAAAEAYRFSAERLEAALQHSPGDEG